MDFVGRNSFTIYGWMSELGLAGLDLLVYSIVWNFSCYPQENFYHEGYAFLSRIAGVDERTIRNIIIRLKEKKLIEIMKNKGRNVCIKTTCTIPENFSCIKNLKPEIFSGIENKIQENFSGEHENSAIESSTPENISGILEDTPYIKDNNNSTTTTTTRAHEDSSIDKDFEKKKEISKSWLMDDDTSLNLQCSRNNLTREDIEKLMDIFIEREIIGGVDFVMKGRTDTKKHFNAWLPKYLRKIREENVTQQSFAQVGQTVIKENKNGRISSSDQSFVEAFGVF